MKLGNRRGEGQTRDQLARGERDEGEMINLEIGLDGQTQWMYHKMGEMMGCSETSVDEGSAAWRREDAGDDWQRWNGNWWIWAEQTGHELKTEEDDIQGPSEDDTSGTER